MDAGYRWSAVLTTTGIPARASGRFRAGETIAHLADDYRVASGRSTSWWAPVARRCLSRSSSDECLGTGDVAERLRQRNCPVGCWPIVLHGARRIRSGCPTSASGAGSTVDPRSRSASTIGLDRHWSSAMDLSSNEIGRPSGLRSGRWGEAAGSPGCSDPRLRSQALETRDPRRDEDRRSGVTSTSRSSLMVPLG